MTASFPSSAGGRQLSSSNLIELSDRARERVCLPVALIRLDANHKHLLTLFRIGISAPPLARSLAVGQIKWPGREHEPSSLRDFASGLWTGRDGRKWRVERQNRDLRAPSSSRPTALGANRAGHFRGLAQAARKAPRNRNIQIELLADGALESDPNETSELRPG